MDKVGIRAAMFFIRPAGVAIGFVLAASWLAVFMCLNLIAEACDDVAEKSA